jgi:hypothetical protein
MVLDNGGCMTGMSDGDGDQGDHEVIANDVREDDGLHDGVGTWGVEQGDDGGMPDEVCDGVSDRGVHGGGVADGDDRADGGCMAGVGERVADEVQEDGQGAHDDDDGGCKVVNDIRDEVGGDDDGVKEVRQEVLGGYDRKGEEICQKKRKRKAVGDMEKEGSPEI